MTIFSSSNTFMYIIFFFIMSYFLFRITSKQLFKKKLEGEVKWASESITMNKASGGDGIPA